MRIYDSDVFSKIFVCLLFSSLFCKSLRRKYSSISKFRQHILYTTNYQLNRFSELDSAFLACQTPTEKSKEYIERLESFGFSGTDEFLSFADDFIGRPEVISEILKSDFGFNPFDAHKLRTVLSFLQLKKKEKKIQTALTEVDIEDTPTVMKSFPEQLAVPSYMTQTQTLGVTLSRNFIDEPEPKKKKYKELIVSSTNTLNRVRVKYGLNNQNNNQEQDECSSYGVSEEYRGLLSILSHFYDFMTQPSPYSQEPPIRKATADVYLRHAKLFLGWALQRTNEPAYMDRNNYNNGDNQMQSISKLDLITNCDSLEMKEFRRQLQQKPSSEITLEDILVSKDKSASIPIYTFVIWLRKNRHISVAYEANMLRGLIKLTKFRFSKESATDVSYGGKSYEDIPLVKELRKLHREANRSQRKTGSTTDDSLKWLSWPEYLQVVNSLRADLLVSVENLAERGRANGTVVATEDLDKDRMEPAKVTTTTTTLPVEPSGRKKKASLGDSRCMWTVSELRAVATDYQRYLLLALMSCIPDRQRTFRELTIDGTLVRTPSLKKTTTRGSRPQEMLASTQAVLRNPSHMPPQGDPVALTHVSEGHWSIVHSAEDYKTGGSYGARPPLPIPAFLTAKIDDFVSNWRIFLQPTPRAGRIASSGLGGLEDLPGLAHNYLFVQPKTGKPFTQDSVYQCVGRACFEKTGKRTNPHLLRDMIVTHVRDSDASEKQLEALALFMGHSIAMQRSSYDRRTLAQKVAPASSLLSNIMQESMK